MLTHEGGEHPGQVVGACTSQLVGLRAGWTGSSACASPPPGYSPGRAGVKASWWGRKFPICGE